MQWMLSQSPTEPDISCVLDMTTMQLCNVTERIATTAYWHKQQWTPKRRHFLATFLTAARAAIVTHDLTCPYTRDVMLKLLDDQLTWHSRKLEIEDLDAAERDDAADKLLQRVRAALAGAVPVSGIWKEGAWITTLAWTLFVGLCQQAATRDGLQYFQTALHSSRAHP